jgi:hypothetical protein
MARPVSGNLLIMAAKRPLANGSGSAFRAIFWDRFHYAAAPRDVRCTSTRLLRSAIVVWSGPEPWESRTPCGL